MSDADFPSVWVEVFAVCYSNYFPNEIDSIWFSEVDARAYANKLGPNWGVCAMKVFGVPPWFVIAERESKP